MNSPKTINKASKNKQDLNALYIKFVHEYFASIAERDQREKDILLEKLNLYLEGKNLILENSFNK